MSGEIDRAVNLALEIAKDDKYGYSQNSRWGPLTFDCSSFVIHCFEEAGIPVKTKGATTTYNMYEVFLSCGFMDVTAQIDFNTGAGTKRGDVLLNEAHHAAIVYADGGKIVNASSPTNGILTRNYYNYSNGGWDYCLRYTRDVAGSLPKIFLNPGHGYSPSGTYDAGACGNGYKEAELTRSVCKSVESLLSGFAEVTVWDYEKDLFQHNPKINWAEYTYFLSIHFNAGGGEGCEIFHPTTRGDNKLEALILTKVCEAGDFTRRGVKSASHKVTNRADKSHSGGTDASLLEVCFVDSASDMEKYAENAADIAKAIADAFIESLSLTYSGKSGWSAPWVKKELPNKKQALINKTYERYWKIDNKDTENYKISCGSSASTHSTMLRVYKDKFLIIALGSYYGPVGTYVKIAFDNGKEIVCIKGDEKADAETNTESPAHSYHITSGGQVCNLLEVQADTERSDWQAEFLEAFDVYSGGCSNSYITGIWTSDTEPEYKNGADGSDDITYFADTNEVIPLHPTYFNQPEMIADSDFAIYVGQRNITEATGPVTLTSTAKELGASMDFELAVSSARFTYTYRPRVGEIVRLFNKTEFFRGVIISEEENGENKVAYTAVDLGWYLNKTKDTYQFEAADAVTVIKKICGDLSIPVLYLDEELLQGVKLSGVYSDTEISEIFLNIAENTGTKVNFDILPTGFRFYKMGRFTSEPVFQTSKNTAFRPSYKYRGRESVSTSIEETKTAVKAVTSQRVAAAVRHDEMYNKYGFLQEIITVDDAENAPEAMAQKELAAKAAPLRTRSFPLILSMDNQLRAGEAIVYEGEVFYTSSVVHTFSKGVHQAEVEVEY